MSLAVTRAVILNCHFPLLLQLASGWLKPVFITGWYCTKIAKHRITQTMPHYNAGTLVFWWWRSLGNLNGVTPVRCQKRLQHAYYSEILAGMAGCTSLYLRNGASSGHIYYGRLISAMCSVEWCYFQWPWVTPKYATPTQFLHFVSAFVSSTILRNTWR